MSDIGDLVALLGELDRTIASLEGAEAEGARAEAAAMIPPYGNADAPGWYDRLLATTGAEFGPSSLSEAMDAMARPPSSRSVLPRRVIAIAAVARALPDRYGLHGEELERTLRALSGPGILATAPNVDEVEPGTEVDILAEASQLLELLVDHDRLPDVHAYREFVDMDTSTALLSVQLRSLPAPCSTDVIEVEREGSVELVLTLATQVCVSGVSLADVAKPTSFMNPQNWARYAYWCDMVPDPANLADPVEAARYLEIVALDCDTRALEVAVWLDFSRLVKRPRSLLRTYTMSRDQSTELPAGGPVGGGAAAAAKANNAVSIDEGSIKVMDEGAHLRVRTTKRVHFTVGLDASTLALLSCGAGYGALAADFVVEGSGGVAQEVGCAGNEPTGVPGSGEVPLGERIAAVGESIDECTMALMDALQKSAEQRYTADELAADLSAAFARSVRAWGRVVDLALAIGRKTDVETISDPIVVDPPTDAPCSLALKGPLLSPHNDPLPVDRVRFVPEILPADADRFEIAVRSAGLRGTTYLGQASLTNVATSQARTVNVDIQVS
jgi:hypothetical protein